MRDKNLNIMEHVIEHQRVREIGKVTFDSRFPAGNLLRCEEVDANTYNLWIGNDPKSNYRTWFYFSVQGIPRKTSITFTIKNMSNQAKMYKEGFLPVFREEESTKWQRVKIPIQVSSIIHTSEGLQFQFKHYFESDQKVFFAFTYPWTAGDWDKLAGKLTEYCESKESMYCKRSILTYSIGKRPVEVVTVTCKDGKETQEQNPQYEGLFKQGCPTLFPKKRGVFISSRVHPGEVPASHIFNGVIKALMSQNQQTKALLQQCVLYLVPFLNPDGVEEGFYRSNSQGENLNRHYMNPNQVEHPEIFHVKELISFLSKNSQLKCCLDLHAHAAKKGCFIYGNSVPDLKKQVDICLFAKLLSLNNQDFDYDNSNFTEANMYQTDKGDNLSKQGAARVGLYKATNIATCWTLEVNYNTGKTKNKLFPKTVMTERFNINSIKKGVVFDYFGEQNLINEGYYSIESFQSIGKGIVQSLVDYFQLSNVSRIHSTPFKNMETLKLNLAVSVLRMIPFKFDQNIRKVMQSLMQEEKVFQALTKICSLLAITSQTSQKIIPTNAPKTSILSNQNKEVEKSKQKGRYAQKGRTESTNKVQSVKSIARRSSVNSKPFK